MKKEPLIDIDLEQIPEELRPYILGLASDHGKERIDAREYLTGQGVSVLPYLEILLSSENRVLRWEAAKTIQMIGDFSSLDVLLDLLEDDDHDIRWIASGGLVLLGEASVAPLLQRVIEKGSSTCLNEGVYHVISALFHGHERKKYHPFLRVLKKRHYSGEMISAEALRLMRELE